MCVCARGCERAWLVRACDCRPGACVRVCVRACGDFGLMNLASIASFVSGLDDAMAASDSGKIVVRARAGAGLRRVPRPDGGLGRVA
jgi:hypothetical protein